MQNFAYARCQAWPADQIIVIAPESPGWAQFDARQPFLILRWPKLGDGVPILRRVFQFLLPLVRAWPVVRHQPIETIECWQPLPFGLIALLLSRLRGIPYLVWCHGNDLRRPWRYPFLRWPLQVALNHAVCLIANSEDTRAELLRLGHAPERIFVMYPFIDTSRFHPQIDETLIKERYRLAGRRVILTVARLDEVKGIDLVIRALPAVVAEVPDVVYLIVGEGPQRQNLERLVHRLGIARHVIFAGPVSYWDDTLPLYYAVCDVFVMTSRGMTRRGERESFGMAYLEASACGKPVVASNVGGVSEAIVPGKTGLLIDPEDSDALAQAIVSLLEDTELARQLGQQGRNHAVQLSDADRLQKMLVRAMRNASSASSETHLS